MAWNVASVADVNNELKMKKGQRVDAGQQKRRNSYISGLMIVTRVHRVQVKEKR